MDHNDPTKLTSFQPLSPAPSSGGFSFSKWFDGFNKKTTTTVKSPLANDLPVVNISRDSKNQSSSSPSTGTIAKGEYSERENFNSWLTKSISSQSKLFGEKENTPEPKSETLAVVPRKEKWRYRNVRTILRRLSALTIEKRWHQTTGDFKDDLKQYWMPDEHCKECYECGDKFNTFRRRHHCRVCGQIFCYKCCSQEVHGKVMGFSGNIRVCNYCYKIVQAYLSDDSGKTIEALSEDIKACESGYPGEFTGSSGSLNSKSSKHLDEPKSYGLKRSPSNNSLQTSANVEGALTPTTQRSPFDMFGVDPSVANSIKQDYLRDLWRRISDPRKGLELRSHLYRLKSYQNCCLGNELTDWFISYQFATSRVDAIGIGQDLLDNGWIECVTPESIFKDEYLLYQPTKMAMLVTEAVPLISTDDSDEEEETEQSFLENESTREEDDDDPNWIKQISMPGRNANEDESLASSSAHLIKSSTAGRQLDLDLLTSDVIETDKKKADLSLQMNLDSQKTNEKKEIYDQNNKVSFITRVPPLPLDTYVNVDGFQSNMKRKIAKPAQNAAMSEEVLRGVVFPSSTVETELQLEEQQEDQGKMDSGEKLSQERLSAANHHHINALLAQLLRQENLSETWKDVIWPFIFKVSEKVIPDVRRDDDMDIRRYVWIAKVPGGLKTDCHFVSGVVFRKNVVHKRMNDNFSQPSIMMMSCAIEYQRKEHKLSSLDPLVLQEYAFLKNFVKRVLALKPNLILVEKNVARVAQDMLLAGGVTLVHNIKSEVMENISRCTGAYILPTMEQVARTRLGKCHMFKVKRFSLPNGEHKTLMYIDGCAPDLGCSLILRGGNEKTLIKVKMILEYLIYVSYQLKLEAKFLMDEFALPPTLEKLTTRCSVEESQKNQKGEKNANGESNTPSTDYEDEEFTEIENNEMDGALISRISEKENIDSIKENESESCKFQRLLKFIILSSSPFCNYQMPFLLTEKGKSSPSRHLIAKKIYWSRYLDGSVNNPIKLVEDDHEWVKNKEHWNNGVITRKPHPFTDPSELMDRINKDGNMNKVLSDFRARGGLIDLQFFREYEAREKRMVFGRYLNETTEDFDEIDGKTKDITENTQLNEKNETYGAKMDCFDAFNHQKIPVLFTSYASESKNYPKPCISPWAVFMEFYGRNDITLGGFLEKYCFRPSYICPNTHCDIPMVFHVRYFAHGNGSLYIHMRNLESPIPGYDRSILTWSWCKVCKQVTPVVPLSLESWAMSFAKYLELRFYGSEYTRRASVEPCNHSLHHDHYQYFSYAHMVASFKYRAIDLYEVIIPSSTVIIGKQRNPKFLLDDVKEIYIKVDSVNREIKDRINELLKADEQLSANPQRELKLKDFLAELEKEETNRQNVVQIIKLKTDSLSKTLDGSIGSSQASENSSNDTTKQSEVKSEIDGETTTDQSSTASRMSDLMARHVEEFPLSDEELHFLWVDITNKVFHLKKNICESVEHWNHSLQDFVIQDRKREKNMTSTVVTSKAAVVAELTEYFPDQGSVELEPPKPKTITHMHPEPVSEVFLTDKIILRQTHYGTTPQYLDSSGRDGEKGGKTSLPVKPDIKLTTENTPVTNKDIANEAPKLENVSSRHNIVSSSLVDATGEETQDIEKGEISSLPNDSMNENTQKMLVNSWIGENKGNMEKELSKSNVNSEISDNESITVECNDDTGELTDNQSYAGEDLDSNFPESDCQSEIEMAEEDAEIRLGQSAVDFELDPKKAGKQSSPSQLNDKNLEIPQKKGGRSRGPYHNRGITEFPRMAEVKIERIEYLTPKEVKKMQMERRESRIRTAKKEQPSINAAGKEESMLFNESHFDNIATPNEVKKKGRQPKQYPPQKNGNEKEIGEAKQQTMSQRKTLIPSKAQSGVTQRGTNLSKVKKHTKNPILKRLGKETFESSGEEKIVESKEKSRPKQIQRDKKSVKPSNPIERVKKQTGPAAKTAQTKATKTLKSTKGNTQKQEFVQKPKKNDTPTNGSNDLGLSNKETKGNDKKQEFVQKPKQDDTFTNSSNEPELSNSKEMAPAKDDFSVSDGGIPVPQVKETSLKAQTLNSKTARPKKMGHRRMKSAPLRMARHEEGNVPSELTPESPFICISPAPTKEEVRTRSFSVGNRNRYKRGQKELSQLAERVVHEDRLDAERDDPEVLQIDTYTMKSASAGEILEGRQNLSALGSDGKSRTPSNEEDTKATENSGLVPLKKKLGHTRNISLSLRSFGHDLDTTDGKPFADGLSRRGGSEKMKKIISQVFSTATFQPIQRPFPSSEQYLPQVGVTSSIVINEREPTSLIAFTLSSQDYAIQLQHIQELMAGRNPHNNLQTPSSLHSQPVSPNITRKAGNTDQKVKSSQRVPSPSPSDVYEETKPPDVVMYTDISRHLSRPRSWAGPANVHDTDFINKSNSPSMSDSPSLKRVSGRSHPLSSAEFEATPMEQTIDIDESSDDAMYGSGSIHADDLKKKEEKPVVDHHIKLQFQNSVARFYCSVYYAEQFRQLRERIFPEGEERFIQSLARCKFWKATGGKSGSSFSKSFDDRFVMKQMSRLEVQSFVDFGPRYFAYINKAIKERRPTALAKLLGVYRIGFKNSVTNATMRQDVLVMENLFYEKKVGRIFDLKGSLRGRKVHMSAKEDVLMDENLLEMICDEPLFIRGHSKAVLSKAIHNDTEFLSTNMVMDYSLLVGIDEADTKLVVGIIDYIRTYTWDKKLESYVKSTGILGGSGKMPTVVSPEVYRTRFTEAMQRYFLMVPDKWTGFGNDLS